MWATKRYGAFTQCSASQGIEKIVKRLTFTIFGVGIFIMLAVLFLVGYGVQRINQAVPLKPDSDLQALEQLLRRKLIVLTREQKEKLTPIVRELTEDRIVPEKVKPLKDKIWDVLDSDQVKSLREWGDRVSAKKYKQDIKRELSDQYKVINEKWFDGRAKEGKNLLKMLE